MGRLLSTVRAALMVVATLGLLAAGGTAMAAGWGALAYQPTSGRHGKAVKQPSEAAAKKAAMNSCGRGCRLLASFKQCAAVAWDPRSKRWGWSRGKSAAEARKWSLQRCRDHGGRTCRVQVVACN